MNRTNTLHKLNQANFPEEEKRACLELELIRQAMPENTELEIAQKEAMHWRVQYNMEKGMRIQAENRESIYEDHFFTRGNNPIQMKEQVVYGVQRDFSIE